jgi:rubredoxin
MTHYTKRCVHCKTTYTYQGSGEGCFRPLNDDRYCPDCKTAIVKALESIPKKFDKVFIETDEVTYDYLLEKRNIQDEKAGGLCTRRVYASLFNTKTGEAEKNDAFDVDNKQYLAK